MRQKEIGLNRDESLASLRIKVDQNQKKKSLQNIFRENELKITIYSNLKIVDYLDKQIIK